MTDEGSCRRFLVQINHHSLGVFGSALRLTVIRAGVQLSQVEFGQDFRGPTAGDVLGAAVGQQFGSTASEFVRRGLSLAPTLDVRPGFAFNVIVTQEAAVRLHRRPNDGPPVSLRLKLPGARHSTLTAYADYYEHEHGEPIEVPDLVIEIVRTFVAGDREFCGWHRNGRAPLPAKPGTRNEQGEGPR